jgi:hypothetical protein
MPIHDLLRTHRVNAVFHGHDHLFATETLDGIVYQAVPQPGHPRANARSALDYGYAGEIREGSGHLRLRFGPGRAEVEFVRALLVEATGQGITNGQVVHRYRLEASTSAEARKESRVSTPP